jgi:hypothetical protein
MNEAFAKMQGTAPLPQPILPNGEKLWLVKIT